MTMTTPKKCYSELIQIPSLEERYEYLRLQGFVGDETFGSKRCMNQLFYSSDIWKQTRSEIILRDEACDLAVPGYEINRRLQVHHINPIRLEDILENRWDILLDPENLICVSFRTHNAIHYGDNSLLPQIPIERKPGDTCPWR